MTARAAFWRGVLDETPLLIGVAPFGLVYGVLALASGLSPWQAFALSFILFGGASQIVFAQLWAALAPVFVLAGSVFVLNLRHVLYSAAMAPYFRALPLRWRIVLAYFLTDEAFAISISKLQSQHDMPYKRYYFLGTGLTLWSGWQLSTLGGIWLGDLIPPALNLGFAIPLTFIALVVPVLRGHAELAAAAVAGGVALLGQSLPWNTWIILAAICGIIAGWAVDKTQRGRV